MHHVVPGARVVSTSHPRPMHISTRREFSVRTHPSAARRGWVRAGAPLLAAALLLVADTAPLAAQASPQGRASNVAVNGAIGAVTATVRQAICGCFGWRGIAQGAVGGAMMSAGKQLAGTEFAASGLIGRQVSALGISAIASVGREHPILLLPLGPVTLQYEPGAGTPVHARADLTELAVLTLVALDREMKVHWPSTVAAGAPVILHDREWLAHGYEAHGFALLGTVFVQSRFSTSVRRELVAHEAVHVLQWDALRQLVTHPAERAVTERIPRFGAPLSRVDVGLSAPAAMLLLGAVIPYHNQPWEREAYLLANGHSMERYRDAAQR